MADEAFAAAKDKTNFDQYDNDGNDYVSNNTHASIVND